jgi:hypothetical protein
MSALLSERRQASRFLSVLCWLFPVSPSLRIILLESACPRMGLKKRGRADAPSYRQRVGLVNAFDRARTARMIGPDGFKHRHAWGVTMVDAYARPFGCTPGQRDRANHRPTKIGVRFSTTGHDAYGRIGRQLLMPGRQRYQLVGGCEERPRGGGIIAR